jgi:hypothetical protein
MSFSRRNFLTRKFPTTSHNPFGVADEQPMGGDNYLSSKKMQMCA